MNSRMKDILVLVSRLDEKRANFRFLLRQDPDVQREVHTYLDDVSWLSRRPAVKPSTDVMAAGKASLLSALKQPKRRKRLALVPHPVVGAIATVGILLSAAMGAQAMTAGVPAPVTDVLTDVLNGFGIVLSPKNDQLNPSELDGSFVPASITNFVGFAAQN